MDKTREQVRTTSPLPAWLRALRPAQWMKNVVVLAALFFAWCDPSQKPLLHGWLSIGSEFLAAFCFCMVSSAVYLVNDIRDVEADRLHPVKRFRPIAAGELSVRQAWWMALGVLAVGGLVPAALLLPRAFGAVLVGYLAMQAGYTFFFKRVAYLDVFVIAAGFVLRAIAGAMALGVRISPWLLLCTFLLALFLALCKRRHEKVLLGNRTLHRTALKGYNRMMLDIQIGIIAGATIVCYAIYTLSPDTVARFKTERLGYTIPFVIFGIFRYLELVYTRDEGGRPEKVLLTDRTMIVTVLLYVAVTGLLFLTA